MGIDFETFYSSDYSVSNMGYRTYVQDPRFDANIVSVTDGETVCACHPKEFPWETLNGKELVSHNREFDKSVFLRLQELGIIPRNIRPAQWFCTAALCAYLQLPRSLAGAVFAVFGTILDKSVRKKAKGRDSSLASEEDLKYAEKDSQMTHAIWKKCEQHWPSNERQLFDITSDMGHRGVLVDWTYVESQLQGLLNTVKQLSAAIPWRPALSIPKFKAACKESGTPSPETTSADDPVFQAWATAHPQSIALAWARQMQRIRSANRIAKILESMQTRRMPDGRMAYELKYFGATTGRWAGGGGFNIQNLNRKPIEGVILRRCIVAPPGFTFAIVDYSQIEYRVLLYLCGDSETLDLFRKNPKSDAYEIHARATMGFSEPETLRDYCDRTGSMLRQLSKARVLGLGFGCGALKFINVAKTMAGLDISEVDSEQIVLRFRETNPRIVALWYALNDACRSCNNRNYILPLPCSQFNPELRRFLIYRNVIVRKDGIECTVGGERVKAYGGLLAENWTQATARDILASAWLRCDAAGYKPVLSIHDELVFEVPEASAEEDLRKIISIMEHPLPWAPGLPLRAEGKLNSVYGK